MKDPMTERIEKALDIKPIETSDVRIKLPAFNIDVNSMEYNDLSAELQALYSLANKAMELQQLALDEVYSCDSQRDKSEMFSSANTALTSSINAIDKATKLKLRILKDYEKSDDDDSDTINASREEILEVFKDNK